MSALRPLPASVPSGVALVSIQAVTRDFGDGRGIFDATLDGTAGKVIAIIGSNGSGKSTLFRCASLSEPIDSGRLFISGYELSSNGARALDDTSRHKLLEQMGGRLLSVAFQNSQPWPHLNVRDNILLPLLQLDLPRDVALQRCERMSAYFGLNDRLSARPWELSGGLQQRLVLARTFALNTPLILLDEATSALDPDWTERVRELVRHRASDGKGILIVSHQMGFVRRVADEVIFLHQGRIHERGDPGRVFSAPSTEALRKFLANA